MADKTSKYGLDMLVGHEGVILHAYDDFDPQAKPVMPGDPISGTLTIGAGHTGNDVYPGQIITHAQAMELLAQDMQWVEQRINLNVKNVELTQPQFDALASHTYNTGGSETLFKRINQQFPEQEIGNWWTTTYISSKGEFMPGLQKRRNEEWELYSEGVYPDQKKKK